jgi:hypothetical protein
MRMRLTNCRCWIAFAILGLVPTLASAAPEKKPEGLVGYWKLTEGVGQTAYDYSGNQAHGRVVGGAKWETDGKEAALRFDGKSGYVEIPGGAWNVGSPVTYMCWFKAEGLGQVFEHAHTGAVAGVFSLGPNGRFAGYDAKVGSFGASLPEPKANEWTFVAFSITPTEIRCYSNGELKSTAAIQGMPRTDGDLFLGARGEVPDGYMTGSIREMAVFNRALEAKEIAALYRNYQQGAPLYQPATGLKVLAVQPEKLLYRSVENGKLDVIVKNFAATTQSATLRVNLLSRLASAQEVAKTQLTLAAHESKLVSVSVPFAGQSFGCVTQATLAQGEAVFDRVENVVSVADNPWLVGVGGTLNPAEVGAASPARLDKIVKDARQKYANWLEMFFWAPDDWGNLNPTLEEWYSGQANYYETKANMHGLMDRAHAQGIKMITYGKHTACGPDGWEIARQHPELFYTNNQNQVSGIYNVRQFDEWNDKDARKKKENTFDWLWLYPDFRRMDALDFGIKQIADSANNLGWDGVRFDGHFTVASDELSAWNMRRLKETVLAAHPQFVLGFNYAFSPENYPVVTHEMREAMAGGGMWMQESIRDFAYGDSLSYDHWTQSTPAKPAYAPHELAVVKQIQAMGGTYHCIYNLDGSPKSVYKLIYGLIAGGHSVYGSHELTPGCGNWGKFMARWSAFLWNPRLQPVANAVEQASVDKPALFWQPLMQEFVDTPTCKYKILHLVNPSGDDLIAKTTLPDPLQQVAVRIKLDAGAQAQRIVVVRPESEPYDVAVEPKMQDGRVEVVVPKVNVWAMVILEESGTFTVPADKPAYTELPDPTKVAEGRILAGSALSNDPLQPPATGLKLAANEQLFETDAGYQNVPGQAASDPEANNGRAQIRADGTGFVYFGRTWMGPCLPGKYQLRIRLKLVDDKQPARNQSCVFEVYIGEKQHAEVIFDSDPKKVPADRHLIIDGKYHDYTVTEIDIHETAFFNVVGTARSVEPNGNRFYSDHCIVTQVQRYTDAQLAAWNPPDKPNGLRTPQGHAPQKTLQVRGMYWRPYAVDKAVPVCTSVYAVPGKYEDLYAYDALVLANIDLLFSNFHTRRMLRDFVADGGRLVVLGGPMTLGQGGLTGTCLEEMLPFILNKPQGGNEVVPCDKPLLLGERPGQPWPDNPALFWRHRVTLKPGATAVAFAGDLPIAARADYNKGLVAVFAGTVLGAAPADATPFWQTASWTGLLQKLATE